MNNDNNIRCIITEIIYVSAKAIMILPQVEAEINVMHMAYKMVDKEVEFFFCKNH